LSFFKILERLDFQELPSRVVNGPDFQARTRHDPEITSPNPARHLFLKPDLGPKAKFTEWVNICTNAVHW